MGDRALLIKDWQKALAGDLSVCENYGAGIEIEEHIWRYVWARDYVKGPILDVPCGFGYGTAILSEKALTIGMDIDEDKVKVCQELYPFGLYFHGDMRHTTFSDGRFRTVVCFEGIEHIEETDFFLREVRRVLSDDGTFLCSTPNKAMHGMGHPTSGHKYAWDKEEFRAVLEKHFFVKDMEEQKSSRGITGWLAICTK